MTALPWLQTTVFPGRGAGALRLADFLTIAAAVVVAALVTAAFERPRAKSDALPRLDGRS